MEKSVCLTFAGLENEGFFGYDSDMKYNNVIKVTAAVIYRGEKYLLCRRMNGLWEFPGGKVEPGETPEQGLVRECREELSIEVSVGRMLDAVRVLEEDGRILEIQFYEATLLKGTPMASVHKEVRYVSKEMLMQYSLCTADREFLERNLLCGKEPGI